MLMGCDGVWRGGLGGNFGYCGGQIGEVRGPAVLRGA